MTNCEKWLFDFLNVNNMVEAEFVREKAKENGFKKSELKEARKNLGVKTWHQFDEGQDTGNWFWHLPDNDKKDQ